MSLSLSLFPSFFVSKIWPMNTFRMAPVKDEDDDRGRGDGFTLCFTISLTFGLPLDIVRSAQNIAKVKCQVSSVCSHNR